MTSVPAPAIAGSSEYGRTWRKDGTLRTGCHAYTFQYRVRPGNVEPPGDDWLFEAFLLDRNGKKVASAAMDSSIDPKRGSGALEFCKSSTVPGRFKIRGKLTVYPPDDDNPLTAPEPGTVEWIKPGFFRL
ncbi:MAG: hypothetical protein WKF50_09260, partial [Nocardioides sp.]